MRERWNHPCVVIWDAQNESVNDTTAKAIQIVSHLDLSNRPWDNGWAAPVSKSDAIEAHPYLFARYMKHPKEDGYLKEMFGKVRNPSNDPNDHSPSPTGKRYTNPVILNEYGWLWLNRDGSPTTLTDKVYETLFPHADTPEKRFEIYAKNLGILTEYWRAHRKAAAVMHFCGLGYSRPKSPRGQTSDNFIDIQNLKYEPHFYKYVRPAFSPVGVMFDFWEKQVSPGCNLNLSIYLINDTYDLVENKLKLRLIKDDKIVIEKQIIIDLKELQKKILEIPLTIPMEEGDYSLEAELIYKGESIKSVREFVVN
jgi:hypothetical protein